MCDHEHGNNNNTSHNGTVKVRTVAKTTTVAATAHSESNTHSHSHSHGHGHEGGDNHGHSHSGTGGHGHGHGHGDHGHAHEEGKFCGCCHFPNKMRITCMLAMTFLFFLVELVAGQITKSISLTTDAFHMLSDSLALVIGLFSIIISKKKSKKNTFGWVRAEVLGPMINSVFLVSLCLGIVIEAIERLFEAKEIHDPELLLIVGAIGLSVNLVGLVIFGHAHSHGISAPVEEEEEEDEDDDESNNAWCSDDDDRVDGETRGNPARIYRGGKQLTTQAANGVDQTLLEMEPKAKAATANSNSTAKSKPNKPTRCQIMSKEANMNMRAVFLHVLADALGSIIVIVSALLNLYQEKLNIPKHLINYIDPVLCISLVILIMSSTIPLFKESALILLQSCPKEIQIKQLKHDMVRKIPGIVSVHELHVWKLSGSKIIATAHVTCHNSIEYMQIATELKAFFHKRGIHSTTIQPEFTDPFDSAQAADNCQLECLKDCNENTCCGVQPAVAAAATTTATTTTTSAPLIAPITIVNEPTAAT